MTHSRRAGEPVTCSACGLAVEARQLTSGDGAAVDVMNGSFMSSGEVNDSFMTCGRAGSGGLI